MDTTKTRTKAFLARFLQNHELQDDDDIFALGFVNSLFAMQLIMFVEQEFGVTVDNEDLDINNFRTVNAIARFVEQKQTSEAVVG